MDTPGNVIDKLMTINLKLYYNMQGGNYEKLINLNLQRLNLQREIDAMLHQIAKGLVKDEDISRPQHKTY